MKFLLFSDPHITTKAEFSKPTDDGLTDYLHRVIESFSWVGEMVVSHRPEFVAMLGDLFDTTGFVETTALHVGTLVCEKLARVCEEHNAELYWLVGNHDIYSKHAHNLKFLHLDVWGEVIERPTLYKCVQFIPWPGEMDLNTVDAKIVLSHLELRGGVLNSKARSEEGQDPLKTPDLWIFNGHYHLPDKIGKRCHQVGSLLSRSFVDGPSLVRGAVLIDYDEQSNNCQIDRLTNPHEISYRTVEILTPEQASLWSQRIDQGFTGLENSFVRIKHDGLYKEEAEKLSYITQGARLDQRTDRGAKVPDEFISETFSPEENFVQYVDAVMVFDGEEDRELVTRRGLAYIATVKQHYNTATKPIEFDYLHVHDFQCLGDFQVDLYNQGLVWVEGVNRDDPADANGAGKTTLPDALLWTLTGVSRYGERSGDDVVGWHATGGCVSAVGMRVGGAAYEVIRGRQPSMLRLLMEGNDISARKMRDTETKVAELIGRSKDVLRHSIFLTADLETRFTALSYPERVRLLEQITEAGVYADVEAMARYDVKRVKDELLQQRGAIESMGRSIVDLNERLLAINGELVAAKRTQEMALSTLKGDFSDAVNRRDVLIGRRRDCATLGVELIEQERIAAAAYAAVKETETKLREKISSFRASSGHLGREAEQKQALIDGGQCPICLSTSVGESLADYMKNLRAKAKQHKAMYEALRAKLVAYEKIVEEKKTTHDNVNLRLNELNTERALIVNDLRDVEVGIENLKHTMQITRGNVSLVEARRNEITSSIEASKANLDEMQADQTRLETDERVHEFLEEAFSTRGIRARMLSTLTVPFLNSRVEFYSDLLGMPFELTTQVESKSGKHEDKIDVLLPGNRTYKACSRGERRRIDLAIQCAINDLAIATGGSRVNLLVVDEVIDPLDEVGVQAFIEVLKHKAKGSTVLLITHKPFLESHAMKRWTLTKEEGISTLQVR